MLTQPTGIESNGESQPIVEGEIRTCRPPGQQRLVTLRPFYLMTGGQTDRGIDL